ncbi:MAG: hypothetical protein WBF33_31270 [Candidatus Nitrosopolaris sp.]
MFFGDLNQNEHERLITAAGIAALVAYFCYQVAYGTNESSYRIGYNTAIANLTNLITVPPPGSTPENGNICDTQDGCPSSDDAQNYCMAIGVGVTSFSATIRCSHQSHSFVLMADAFCKFLKNRFTIFK